MAATMHAKMNRRKLDQINIIKICEEILNPSVPMALRLSGILMGGVVIVYERKVKLLYDDVSRLVVELNEAWKAKPAADPTLLPKGKTHAKFSAVTFPDKHDNDLGETDGLMDISENHTTMEFQQPAYFAMRLDNLEDLSENFREAVITHHHHQVNTANITLFDSFDVHQIEMGPYERFERFDAELDEETYFNFPPQEQTEILTTLIPSPPSMQGPKDAEILDKKLDDPENADSKQVSQKDAAKQMQTRRKGRRQPAFMIDDEQTIILGNQYQSWLRSSTDIISRKGKDKNNVSALSKMKRAHLMDLPSLVLSCGLIANCTGEVHYPKPLMELWMRSSWPPQDAHSGRTSPPHAPEASSSPAPRGQNHQNPLEFDLVGFENGVGSPVLASRERQRASEEHTYVTDIGLMLDGFGVNERNQSNTPTLSGVDARSMSTPSLGSGQGHISTNSDGNSLKSSKKRPFSSSRNSGSFLEPLYEEHQWGGDLSLIEERQGPNFKLAKWSHNGLSCDPEILVETGPTQIQHPPIMDESTENRTNIIRKHLKSYFETPGVPQAESLNQLACGMNKQQAAQLFYQICILASRDFLEVEQIVAYGDILISKGPKM